MHRFGFLSMRNTYLIYLLILAPMLSHVYAATHASHSINSKNFSEAITRENLPWSLEVGLGYGKFEHMYNDDGLTAIARIGIAKEFVSYQRMIFGLEMGVQNGNEARLSVPQSTLYSLGGLPIETTIKPMLDVLLTDKFYIQEDSRFFTQLKVGAVLQRLQFNRGSINDLTQVNPELQLGFGYDFNRWGSIALSYQGIFGQDPHFKIVSQDCYARVSHIPGMNGVILGLSIHLGGAITT